MISIVSGIASLFTALAVQGVVLAVVTAAALAGARRLQKRYGPQWLCRAWLALAVLFLLPLRLLLPTPPLVQAAVPVVLQAPLAPLARPAGVADLAASPAAAGTALPTGSALQQAALFSGLQWLALLWVAGALAVLLWQGGSYLVWRRRTLARATAPHASWQAALQTARAMPGQKMPRLLATPAVQSPLVAGVLRPVLLVPTGPAPAGAGYMLSHELAHLARRDVPFKALLVLVCAAHWYNPAAWALARRAGQDIEAACDAAALQGRDGAYRAAYADALLNALRQSHGPALTTGFALSKRQFKARLAALWDTTPKRRGVLGLAGVALAAALLAGLVGCQSPAPADESEPTPTPPAESTAAAAEVAALTLPELPEDPRQLSAPLRAAADALQKRLDTNPDYAVARVGMSGAVAPDADLNEALTWALTNTQAPGGGSWVDYLQNTPAVLIQLSYYVEYQPEVWYSGPQYGDGTAAAYMAVGLDGSDPQMVLLEYPADATTPELTDEARALGLTTRQYLMLTRQTAALAAAGLRDFATPADWTRQQTLAYLGLRSPAFYPSGWGFDFDADTVNRLLAVDFTSDFTETQNRFFPADWPTATQADLTAAASAAVPLEPDRWEYQVTPGQSVTATGYDAAGNAVQRYDFAFSDTGTFPWADRTYCTGAASLL